MLPNATRLLFTSPPATATPKEGRPNSDSQAITILMDTPSQPPATPEHLLLSLQLLTNDRGCLSADTVAAADDTKESGIPAKSVRAITLAVQEIIPHIDPILLRQAAAWGAVSQLLTDASNLASACEAQVVGADDAQTAELEDN